MEIKQAVEANAESEHFSANNPCCISPDEYFSGEDLKDRDIGRPKEMTRKVQKFQAQLWLCEEYPLSLQEQVRNARVLYLEIVLRACTIQSFQVMPIVDLMAISNTHFQKLKDFITCSFPAGFPVKIEIPLFHVLNARITFGNIFGLTNPVAGIQGEISKYVPVMRRSNQGLFCPPQLSTRNLEPRAPSTSPCSPFLPITPESEDRATISRGDSSRTTMIRLV